MRLEVERERQLDFTQIARDLDQTTRMNGIAMNEQLRGNDQVYAVADRYWAWRMQDSPDFASLCGIDDYDDQWDDVSDEAYAERVRKSQEFLSELEQIDTRDCTRQGRNNCKLLMEDLRTLISGSKFKSHYFPMSFLEGIHIDLGLISSFHNFQKAEGYRKYLARLRSLPDRILQIETVMRQAAEEGVTAHQASMKVVPQQLTMIINTPPSANVVLQPFRDNEAELESDELDTMKREGEFILETQIKPALTQLRDYIINEYNQQLREREGLASLPWGVHYYEACLNFHISIDMAPSELHQLGDAEVQRIKRQLLDFCQEKGIEENLPSLREHIMQPCHFFSSGDELLRFTENLCYNVIRPRLRPLFRGLPDSQMLIIPKGSTEINAPSAYYYSGSVDGSRPGKYYINTAKPETLPRWSLPSLSLHEGEPGHHLQSEYALAQTEQPSFRVFVEDMKYYLAPGRFPLHTAYIEGWGLYAESLGEELELYTDPYDLIGRYQGEILRAARLAVDTGIHVMGWSREDGLKYLLDNTLEPLEVIASEVDRYITWPGQACAYKVGELKLWEFRNQAQKELGENFDLSDFHEVILNTGPVHLSFLDTIVKDYIAETKSAIDKE